MISCITPVHNRAALLAETVQSVADQRQDDTELIVVDDGSTEDIPAVLHPFENTPGLFIRYERVPHGGGNAARAHGQRLATRPFLQFLDSDDVLHPGKWAAQIAHLQSHPELDASVSETYRGVVGSAPLHDPRDPRTRITVRNFLLRRSHFVTAAPLWRRERVLAVAEWPPALTSSQDWETHLRALLCELRLAYCAGVGYTVRTTAGQRVDHLPAGVKALNKLRAMGHAVRGARRRGYPPTLSTSLLCMAVAARYAAVFYGDRGAVAKAAYPRACLRLLRTCLRGRPEAPPRPPPRAIPPPPTASAAWRPAPPEPGVVLSLDTATPDGPRAAPSADENLAEGCTAVVVTRNRPALLANLLTSLEQQHRRADALMVVDAGDGDEARAALTSRFDPGRLATRCRYYRVAETVRGTTRQRNFALRRVATDLVVFFDDDAVLTPGCLGNMERVMRARGGDTVGVGAFNVEWSGGPGRLWSLRRWLGAVPALAPGRHYRSGLFTNWFPPDGDEDELAGDWLPGYAMMWRTGLARALRFDEDLPGYGAGEDKEFSVRARRRGELVMAYGARMAHVIAAPGRPGEYEIERSGALNGHTIHRRAFPEQRWYHRAWYAYAYALEALLLLRQAPNPSRWNGIPRRLAGRIAAAWMILRGRH